MYFNGGFQIVNEIHKPFFKEVLDFYYANKELFVEKQKASLGTDQTPINYLVQSHNIDLKIFPPTYNLHHMLSKNLLYFGWGWWPDDLQNMCEQGWVYHFNAIPQNNLGRNSGYFLERAYKELWEK